MRQLKKGMKKHRTKKGKMKQDLRACSRERKPEQPPEIKEFY